MDLQTLKPTKGKAKSRVGRGNGSGKGKTCGRGTKGQGARSGGSIHPWFEGGQMPLYRRLPIRGFNNARFTKRYQIVNLSQIASLPEDGPVNPETLYAKGLINSEYEPVKILGDGELKAAYKVSAHKFSKSAAARIATAGGESIVLERVSPRAKSENKDQSKV